MEAWDTLGGINSRPIEQLRPRKNLHSLKKVWEILTNDLSPHRATGSGKFFPGVYQYLWCKAGKHLLPAFLRASLLQSCAFAACMDSNARRNQSIIIHREENVSWFSSLLDVIYTRCQNLIFTGFGEKILISGHFITKSTRHNVERLYNSCDWEISPNKGLLGNTSCLLFLWQYWLRWCVLHNMLLFCFVRIWDVISFCYSIKRQLPLVNLVLSGCAKSERKFRCLWRGP